MYRPFNASIELNVIVDNGQLTREIYEIFYDSCARQMLPFIVVNPQETDIYDFLVQLGSFPSKGQARKNWNGIKRIPIGYEETQVGKGAKMKVLNTYWMPPCDSEYRTYLPTYENVLEELGLI